MSNLEKPAKPLHQRVSEILHFNDADYIVEESENDSAIALFQELQQAEEDLERVQQRIARLRSMLASQPDDEPADSEKLQ